MAILMLRDIADVMQCRIEVYLIGEFSILHCV